jgi:serine/threonine protein kinase
MSRPKLSSHTTILSSITDAILPDQFTNDFSKYGSHQPIAGGGHGVLTASLDGLLGRTVALKSLHPEHATSEQEQRRLLREARITAQLQHPNTVPVYELGKRDDGAIYFAMKKVEGENLFQVIVRIAQGDDETKTQYPLNRLLGVLVQSSNALAYAHSRGVIHRDVKPENILLGPFGEVYLMDWGVAKVWGMAAEIDGDVPVEELYQRLTATGKRPGTPLYMSPEQTTSAGIVDERSDIFSMGVVLYEILAQREPFRGKTIEETFRNIQTLTPPGPSTIASQMTVPVALDRVCLKALEKKPANRYQSISEMIQEIRDIREEAISSL